MYWELVEVSRGEAPLAAPPAEARRFVLHRHEDTGGWHFDLRIEEGNSLLGWRIAGEALAAGCWATEKMPHPVRWLDEDGDARREASGVYVWRERGASARELVLYGETDTQTVRFVRAAAPSVDSIRALAGLAHAHDMALDQVASLAADGLRARRNAIARFCGLSRRLDGEGFDETGWRQLLSGLGLAEIDARLALVETRYDRVHPPTPTSRPGPLPESADVAERLEEQERAMRIARED